ncbi:MAG: hypothetical protein V1781_03470 [Bacteroidota bacterium]
MNLKIPTSHLPFYLLILSLFQKSFIIQYIVLLLFILFFLFTKKPVIKKNIFFSLPLLIIAIAFISYLYNWCLGNADGYTFFFWLFSYLPPFILIWITIAFSGKVNFFSIYKFYKILVYIQSVLLIFSTIQYDRFIVGDFARGTVGDANWVAFHICVVLLYEISQLVVITHQTKTISRKNIWSIAEIIYLFIVLLIPESTANLGLLLIILGIIFIKEYILAGINMMRIIVFVVFITLSLWGISKTYVYERIDDAITELTKTDIDKNPYLSKISIYKKLLNGEIYSNTNWLIGSGPATFTSRSSVMRMPDERVNEFPIELPYFKSNLFKKYISPIYAEWKASRESYGNFASPQTTIISVAVELGIFGILCFLSLFYFIIRRTQKIILPESDLHLKKFFFYFSIFYILSLFHLNFWEYPIVTFTYIIFVFL